MHHTTGGIWIVMLFLPQFFLATVAACAGGRCESVCGYGYATSGRFVVTVVGEWWQMICGACGG